MKSMALDLYDHSYIENKLYGSTALLQANIFNFIFFFLIAQST